MKSSFRTFLKKVFPTLLLHYDAYQHLINNINSYLYTSGWMASLQARRPMDANGLAVPWMNFSIVEFLNERLTPDLDLFEFGSGFSTKFYAERVRSVISVEYDKTWLDIIAPEVPDNATIIYQEKDSDGDYCRQASVSNQLFDVIVIDGRDRVNCILQSTECLTERGVLLLDDSHRSRYRVGIDHAISLGFKCLTFSGLKPEGTAKDQTTILYRSKNCLKL